MKQIEVQILQQSYLLSCPEGHEGRLLDAVERVDTAMTKIRDAGKVRARERIAVLAALNLAFEIADRDAADLAARSAERRAAEPSPVGPTTAQHELPLPGSDDERLRSLVGQLDDVLGGDGRLL